MQTKTVNYQFSASNFCILYQSSNSFDWQILNTDTELELINTDTDTHWEILNTDAWYNTKYGYWLWNTRYR